MHTRTTKIALMLVTAAAGCSTGAGGDSGRTTGASALTSNLVKNGSFETGLAPWGFVTRGGATGTEWQDDTAHVDGAWSEHVSVFTATPTVPWNVQLSQSGIPITAGQALTVSFWAKASSARPLSVFLQEDASPWTAYGDQSVTLTTSWTSYSFSFTPSVTDPSALIDFNFAAASGDVWIDAVSVMPADGCAPATPADAGGAPPPDAGPAVDAADAGSAPPPDASGPGASFMPVPAGWSTSDLVWVTDFGYSGMGASPAAPNQGAFVANGAPAPDTTVGLLNDWNFGLQEAPGGVWSRSGSSPYWGSSEAAQTGSYASGFAADYSFPGNVYQTSAGPNASLFGGYAPQAFTAQGGGLTLFDHYVGGPQSLPIYSNGSIYYYEWTSGVLNTEGKRFFPFGGATEFFVQFNAKMAGPNSGSWSAIWMLPDQGEGGTGQEIDIQEYNVEKPAPYSMFSHVQNPVVSVGTGTSATRLDAGYHVYGCDVNSATQTVTMYLDGVKTGSFTGAQVGSKYFLILDAALSSGQASWEQAEGFVPDSTADMAMGVSEVQVYQR